VAVVLHMHLVVVGGSGKHYQCCRLGILEVLTFCSSGGWEIGHFTLHTYVQEVNLWMLQ
jgi:hypothetical protein